MLNPSEMMEPSGDLMGISMSGGKVKKELPNWQMLGERQQSKRNLNSSMKGGGINASRRILSTRSLVGRRGTFRKRLTTSNEMRELPGGEGGGKVEIFGELERVFHRML